MSGATTQDSAAIGKAAAAQIAAIEDNRYCGIVTSAGAEPAPVSWYVGMLGLLTAMALLLPRK
jgi:hypothetical protein